MKKILAVFILLLLNINIALCASLPSSRVPEGLGVNIHFTGKSVKDIDMIADAGFKFVRMDFFWARVERIKGYYTFGEYDKLVQSLKSRGIRALFILDYNNPVYGQNWNEGIRSKERIQAFARFAAAAAERYKNDNVIWEIWNEPNMKGFWEPAPSPEQYMALLKAVVPALKNADPTAKIIAPALSPDYNWREFLKKCLFLGLLNYIDALSIHPYMHMQPESGLSEPLNYIRNLIKRNSKRNIPVYISEWGYPVVSSRNNSAKQSLGWNEMSYLNEQVQAVFISRLILLSMSKGIPFIIIYDWKNDGTEKSNPEHNFGLIRADYSPKPAFFAIKKLTESLSGKSFKQRLKSSQDDYLLLFSDSKVKIIAGWTTSSPHSVKLPDGKLIQLSQEPVYINYN